MYLGALIYMRTLRYIAGAIDGTLWLCDDIIQNIPKIEIVSKMLDIITIKGSLVMIT